MISSPTSTFRKERAKLNRNDRIYSGRRISNKTFILTFTISILAITFFISFLTLHGFEWRDQGRSDLHNHHDKWMLGNIINKFSFDFPCKSSSNEVDLHASPQIEYSRTRVVAFVGIQTGFGNSKRRESIRNTWLIPSDDPLQMQSPTGLEFKFIIGKSEIQKEEEELKKEMEKYNDILRIDLHENYQSLNLKTLYFFKLAFVLYAADFYIKMDDDVYLRPDRLAVLLSKERKFPRTYLGCMKKGPVITNPNIKWHEPKHYILGSEYFLHAYGPIYGLSNDIVKYLVNQPPEILRMFMNEDVTVGSWMLGLDVNYEHNMDLCSRTCTDRSIAVWDLPTCSGLCDPEKRMIDIHKDEMCSNSPTLKSNDGK